VEVFIGRKPCHCDDDAVSSLLSYSHHIILFLWLMILKSILSPVTKRHVQRQTLQTHPLHLFRIIQNVDDYMNFLPLCSYSKIIRRSPDGRSFDGKLIVGKPPLFSEEYISRVSVIPEKLTIETVSIDTQRIDSLRSRWSLTECTELKDDDDAQVQCGVNFELE
jgi:ribosome-associated toxin RatA of RatAB toxin-antitoxin module